jgi:hypothetical protein
MSQSPEDDRTVLSNGAARASANDLAPHHPHALPAGTRLNEFEITGILGEGGFGIVYLAYDHSLERQVALKEYMPSFAWRSDEAHVSVKSSQNVDSFEAGLRNFIIEAHMLAKFDHPSLVKVYRFWEANGTGYMAMPYYRGPTLKQVLHDRTTPPDEAWIRSLLAPLIDVLEVMHEHRCFHRDIAPDNILILDDGRPLLLDLGAARQAVSDTNQAFTVILKQNYAPIEQYAEMPGMSQGPWTDLYALGSVVHFAIDGQPPPPALNRMMSDPYVPLATRYTNRYSRTFLEAIDRTLAFKPEERPQSVTALRAMLGLNQPAAAPAPAATPVQRQVGVKIKAAPGRRILPMSVAAVVLVAVGVFAYTTQRLPLIAAVPTAAAPTAVAPAATRKPVFDPLTSMNAILAGANPAYMVTAQALNSRVRIKRDKLDFSVRSSHAGFIYIFLLGTKGDDFQLLFPNANDKENHIAAGDVLNLPRPGWRIAAFGPPGIDHFLVMVSEAPRDFSGAGLTAGDPISSFPIARAAQLQAAYTGTTPLFAGVPVCTGAPCPASYGAAAFSIEEVTE